MFSPTARGFPLALGLLVAASVVHGGRAHAQSSADVPKLAGTWTWTWKDPNGGLHRHTLEIEGVGTKLAAREIFDDQTPVRVPNLSLVGNAVKFNVVRDDRRAEYSGKVVDDDHINGTVQVSSGGQSNEFVWKAERKKEPDVAK